MRDPRQSVGEHLIGLALMAGTLAYGAPSGLPLAGSLGIFALGALCLGPSPSPGTLTLPTKLLLALSALGFLQLLPLPSSIWQLVAPGTAALSQGINLPLGQMISISPSDTLQGAAFLALGALGLHSLGKLTPRGARRLQGWMLLTLCIVLGWGALQGLGFYGDDMEVRRAARAFVTPLGPFLNRDHAAAFILMSSLMTLPWILSWKSFGPWLGAGLSVVSLGAISASESRGAILGLMGAIFTLALTLALMKSRRALTLALLSCVPLGWLAAPALLKVVSLATGKRAGLGMRGSIWADSAQLIGEQPLLGWGSGTFGRALPHVWSTQGGFFPAHAHSDPLELVVEYGLLGAGITAVAALLIALRLGRQLWGEGDDNRASQTLIPAPNTWTRLGAISALGAGLLHSAVDFHLHLGAIAILTIIALALSLGALVDQPSPQRHPAPPRSPFGALFAPGLLLVGALLALSFTLPTHPKGPIDPRLEALFRGPAPYERCVERALASSPDDLAKGRRARRCGLRALRLSPSSYIGALGVVVGRARAEGVEAATPVITRWSALAPTRWEAPWQLAFVHLREGEERQAKGRLMEAIEKSRRGHRPKRIAQLWRQPGARQWLPPIARAFPAEAFKAAQRLAIDGHPMAAFALKSLGPEVFNQGGGLEWALLLLGAQESEGMLKDGARLGNKENTLEYATILAAWKAGQRGDKPRALQGLGEMLHQNDDRLVALAALGLINFELMNPQEVSKMLTSRHGNWPASKEIRGALLHAFIKAGEWEVIKSFVEKWVSLEPNRPHLQHTLGEAHQALDLPGVASLRLRAQKGQTRHPLLAEAICHCRGKIRALKRNAMVVLNR